MHNKQHDKRIPTYGKIKKQIINTLNGEKIYPSLYNLTTFFNFKYNEQSKEEFFWGGMLLNQAIRRSGISYTKRRNHHKGIPNYPGKAACRRRRASLTSSNQDNY